MLVLFLMAGLGLIGFLDDYIKISKQRSLGLRSQARSWPARRSSASIFAVLALQFPNARSAPPPRTYISFVRDTNVDLAFAGTRSGCCCSCSGPTS